MTCVVTGHFINEAAFARAVGLPAGSIWQLVEIGRVVAPTCVTGYLFSYEQARRLCRECALDPEIRAEVQCIAGRTTYLAPRYNAPLIQTE